MRYLRISFLFSVLILFHIPSICNAEEWINTPPFNFTGEQLLYYVIPSDERYKYIELLSERPYCMVERSEYTRVTGVTSSKKYTIALRALFPIHGGTYRVIQNSNTDISVRYYVLGSSYDVIYRNIIFVEVDNLPGNVYVSFSVNR